MHRSPLPWKKLPRGMLVRTGEKKSRSLSGIYVQTNMIKKFRDGGRKVWRKLHSLIMQLTLVNFWVVELKIKRKLMQRFLKKSRLLHAYVDM